MDDREHGLRTLTLEVTLRAREEVGLPGWTGSTLHGALGTALSVVTCSRACDRSHAFGARPCAFSRLFLEPPAPGAAHGVVAGMRPHPLVLRPPSPGEPRVLKPGDCFGFGLTLVGRAIDDFGPVAAALEVMAERGLGKGRGRLRLAKVESHGQPVFPARRALAAPRPDGPASPPRDLRAIRMRTVTPLRLYRDGKPIHRPAFADVVEAVNRRHHALARFHAGALPPSFPPLGSALDAAREIAVTDASWRTFRVPRYSARQDRKYPTAGTQGFAVYEGPIAPYWELLDLATRIGIGKATSFGFGLIAFEPL